MSSSLEQLNRHLFSSITRVYAVLDGASVPDLPIRLFEMRPPNFCLFTGELEPDMQFVAPYLVRLLPKTPFTEWIFQECWGKHWGIFAHSRQPINEMRKHFRGLTTAYDESGQPLVFRFYDPRVARKFLPTCDAGQLKEFFGAVDAFFAESEDKGSLMRLQLENEKLVETPLPMG